MAYGTLNLTETSPPQSFLEPLALEEVKSYLGLPERSPADAMEDVQLEMFISAARDFAEFLQGRDLVEKQYDLSLYCFPCREIELRDGLSSVDLVQYRDSDGELHEFEDYIVDTKRHPGVVMPAYGESWPSFTAWPSSPVLIRFTAGYPPDHVFWTSGPGARIKQGMLLLISGWFNNKIPYQEFGNQAIQEYPFAVTACLSYGAVVRVR